MSTAELMRVMLEHDKMVNDHHDFYDLAEKYGFLAPWSKREDEDEVHYLLRV